MLSLRAADMPSKIGRTHGLVVEPHPSAHRQNKVKDVSVDQTEFQQAYNWSIGHQAFTNGYQRGSIKHSLMDPKEGGRSSIHNVKGLPWIHVRELTGKTK